MNRYYNIKPTIKRYGCMVDLLGRAGLVVEAYTLIKSMPVECNVIIWRTLLAACRNYGNVELGEKVRKHLLELEYVCKQERINARKESSKTRAW
ncbi:hypothetical protein MtrunA17_Chr3g0078691 [Medicago truncatula]|uniref:Pentatricopeptide n=1 Tax=Medicago truncatula TaxID=3880 RepID=A0A396IQW8_MEDTR|nr:hypothetical protein MtrunA17_Chr3g0078691 [Medicago truncatula]